MTGFVLDSSVAASWLFIDERAPATQALAHRLPDEWVVAPALFQFEVANILLMGVRRKRLSSEAAEEQLSRVLSLPIEFESLVDPQHMRSIWQLASLHGLTFYDAAYLDLAIRRALPLATLDVALIVACQRCDVLTLP